MRKIVTVLIALLFAGGALASPASAASRFKHYRGHLDDGGAISVQLRVGPNATRLSSIDFEVTLTCEDATTQEWGIGIAWIGGEPVLTDRELSLDMVDPDGALHVHGTFGARRASGTLRYTVATLTDDEQAQLCTSGDRTWTMRRIRSAGAPQADASLDGRIRIRIGPSGSDPVVRVRAG